MLNIQPQTTNLIENGSVGFLEKGDAKTVLDCRTGKKIFFDESAAMGRFYFADVVPFENTEELRRHFNYFIKCNFPTENFALTCRVKNQDVPAKAKLVRVIEKADIERPKTTIVDTKRV